LWIAQVRIANTLRSVDEYLLESATLRLKHDHLPSSGTRKPANVNIQHVLESVQRHEVDVGSWINVIGYVERRKEKGVHVQAIAVWDAGNVDLHAYQSAVEKRKEAG
jgi:hypothetical protein